MAFEDDVEQRLRDIVGQDTTQLLFQRLKRDWGRWRPDDLSIETNKVILLTWVRDETSSFASMPAWKHAGRQLMSIDDHIKVARVVYPSFSVARMSDAEHVVHAAAVEAYVRCAMRRYLIETIETRRDLKRYLDTAVYLNFKTCSQRTVSDAVHAWWRRAAEENHVAAIAVISSKMRDLLDVCASAEFPLGIIREILAHV